MIIMVAIRDDSFLTIKFKNIDKERKKNLSFLNGILKLGHVCFRNKLESRLRKSREDNWKLVKAV
jgi:hypothetical protein